MKGQKKNTAAMVYDLAKPIADEAGVYLWDVRFEKEGASWFLRVLIDSDEGISFDDCEAVSRPLSDRLDEKDFIEQSYYLEVSSPGLMRELRKPDHFAVCEGDPVWVKLIRPDETGAREYRGTLGGYEDGVFSVALEDGERSFRLADCAFVKLDDEIEWEA